MAMNWGSFAGGTAQGLQPGFQALAARMAQSRASTERQGNREFLAQQGVDAEAARRSRIEMEFGLRGDLEEGRQQGIQETNFQDLRNRMAAQGNPLGAAPTLDAGLAQIEGGEDAQGQGQLLNDRQARGLSAIGRRRDMLREANLGGEEMAFAEAALERESQEIMQLSPEEMALEQNDQAAQQQAEQQAEQQAAGFVDPGTGFRMVFDSGGDVVSHPAEVAQQERMTEWRSAVADTREQRGDYARSLLGLTDGDGAPRFTPAEAQAAAAQMFQDPVEPTFGQQGETPTVDAQPQEEGVDEFTAEAMRRVEARNANVAAGVEPPVQDRWQPGSTPTPQAQDQPHTGRIQMVDSQVRSGNSTEAARSAISGQIERIQSGEATIESIGGTMMMNGYSRQEASEYMDRVESAMQGVATLESIPVVASKIVKGEMTIDDVPVDNIPEHQRQRYLQQVQQEVDLIMADRGS